MDLKPPHATEKVEQPCNGVEAHYVLFLENAHFAWNPFLITKELFGSILENATIILATTLEKAGNAINQL